MFTEEKVKKYLWFLIEKYGMSYVREDFEVWDGWEKGTYSFYNDNGCFTIEQSDPRDGVGYFRLDSIHSLKDFVLSEPPDNEEEQRQYVDERRKHYEYINIFDVEPEIWEKHKRSGFLKMPFFWGSAKQVLRGLAEVIETQIQKTGQFFGIKVK